VLVLPLVKGIMLVVIAVVVVVLCLSLVECLHRQAVARRHRRDAEARLGAAMRETEERLAREKATTDHAGALTSVVPAIKRRGTRHVA
jgi:Tfp pilus assembly protein PilE